MSFCGQVTVPRVVLQFPFHVEVSSDSPHWTAVWVGASVRVVAKVRVRARFRALQRLTWPVAAAAWYPVQAVGWCVDPRPGLGYRVIAREVIPAGSFVYEYAGNYLPVSSLRSLTCDALGCIRLQLLPCSHAYTQTW